MPYIHIQISGSPDDELTRRVAQQAHELTAQWLSKEPSLIAVAVDFIEAGRWFIAGQPLSNGSLRSYHWRIGITDETNTKRQKASYLQAVHEAMGALLGGVAEHSYTEVADLRAGAYGYAGRTQEARYQHPA